ncbi:MAG TPA: sigma-70 family RNA polymerase sigma factor [Gemmatimonadales bacterium]|nr:sigma-70 family RNA polymerase sigma factor [Gemmatimonadales bacterium]
MSTTAPWHRADAAASEEARLVAEARSGDASARERLISRYLADVYDVTLRVLGDRDLAQDAAQDAWVNALGALGRFRGEASFRTWVLRIAINSARSLARRRGRRREVDLTSAEAVPGGDDPSSGARFSAESDRVADALAKLPEKQRLAVSLRIYQGLGYQEIAELTDSTEGSARVNYHLGIKRLREMLR